MMLARQIYPALIDYSYNLVTTCKEYYKYHSWYYNFYDSRNCILRFRIFAVTNLILFIKYYSLIESLISETEIEISNVTRSKLIYYFISQYIIILI